MKLQNAACIFLYANGIACCSEAMRPSVAQSAAVSAAPAAASLGFVVTPLIFSLGFNDPDQGVQATGTVFWDLTFGKPNYDWELTVRADSGSLANCPGIPLSALRLACISVAKTGTGNPRGDCRMSTAPLSAVDRLVASGNRGGKNSTFTVTVSVSFIDSWKYPASQSCNVSLTYTLNYDLRESF